MAVMEIGPRYIYCLPRLAKCLLVKGKDASSENCVSSLHCWEVYVVAFRSPAEVVNATVDLGEVKARRPLGSMLILGLFGGAFIALAAAFSLSVTANAGPIAGTGPAKLVAGMTFAVGLMLVLFCGAELFTGNSLMVAGLLSGRISGREFLRNWVVVYLSNFAGALLVVMLYYSTGLWRSGEAVGVGAAAAKIAASKVSLGWLEAFSRGILCNWLVCLAIWMAYAAQDGAGKIAAVFFVITAFVASGYEHSVANMFYVPLGLAVYPHVQAFTGPLAGELSWTGFLLRNLVPVTLGNIVGGGILVSAAYLAAFRPGQRAKAGAATVAPATGASRGNARGTL